MKIKNLVIIITMAILSACQSTKHLISSAEFYTSEPQVSSYIVPSIADLTIAQEPIKYTETIQLEDASISQEEKNQIAESEKNNVLYRALQKYNAYIMMAPLFAIGFQDNLVVITVQGFPATIKSWRSATKNDEWIINSTDTPNSQQTNQHDKPKFFFKH